MALHSVLQLSMLQQPSHQGSHMVAHAEVSQWDTQCPADMLHKCITTSNLHGANTLIGYKQMCPLATMQGIVVALLCIVHTFYGV